MTHMHLQDMGLERSLVLAAVVLVAIFIFWVTGDNDDGPSAPGALSSGPKLKRKET